MFCPKCGKNNDPGAKFCGYCGYLLPAEEEKQQEQKTAEEKMPDEGEKKKKKNKVWIWICLAILLLAAVAAVFFSLRKQKIKKQYEGAVATADKYLEAMDYENAEAAYLEAIKIDPKQKEPYVKLVDLYLDQGDTDSAVDIAVDAVNNLPEDDAEEFTEIIEIWGDAEGYEWVVEPEVEADNIEYLKEENYWDYAANDTRKQMTTAYAVIQRGDSYSLIGLDGELVEDFVFDYVSSLDFALFLHRREPKYEATFGMEWSGYEFAEDEGLYPGGERGSVPAYGGEFYCYDGKAYNILEGREFYFDEMADVPEHAIPVRKVENKDDIEYMEYDEALSEKYAIYKKDALITDFIYEDCGSSASGILAVKQNGKWGYIDEEGNVVIPIEYDSSWSMYDQFGAEVGGRLPAEICYAAEYGFVPLVKDGKWEMRRADGTVAIPSGVFEVIRPVQNDGKCWVKKDGKWGVIQFRAFASQETESVDNEEKVDDKDTNDNEQSMNYEEMYGEILRCAGDNIYYIYDIDQDGIKELLLQNGTCEADYTYHIYTIDGGGSVFIGQVEGWHTFFCTDTDAGTDPYIIKAMSGSGYVTLFRITKNGLSITEERFVEDMTAEEFEAKGYPQLTCTGTGDLSLLQ